MNLRAATARAFSVVSHGRAGRPTGRDLVRCVPLRQLPLLALLLPMHEGAPPLRVVQASMPHGASRRKLACAALGIGASWCGSAAQAADSNVATSARETNLERMRAGAAEKERICEGRPGPAEYLSNTLQFILPWGLPQLPRPS